MFNTFPFKNLRIKLFIIFFMLPAVLFECSKKANVEPASTYHITTEYADYSPYELISIRVSGFDISPTGFKCYIGGINIPYITSEDKEVVFVMVPSTTLPGQHLIKLENGSVSVSIPVTINAKESYPGDAKTYLTNFIGDLSSKLNTLASAETNPVYKDSLLSAKNQLDVSAISINQMSDSLADVFSNYIYVNGRALEELEQDIAEIDSSIVNGSDQRLDATGYSTAEKYKIILGRIGQFWKNGQYRMVVRNSIGTLVLGTLDAAQGAISLLVAVIRGQHQQYIQEAKSTITELVNWVYWAPVPYTGHVLNQASQSINSQRAEESLDVSVVSNTNLRFTNFKTFYRNMQEDDRSSKVPMLADLTKAFISVRDTWNGFALKVGFGTIDFAPAKSVGKSLKNVNAIQFSCDNPNISIASIQGSASNFTIKITAIDTDIHSGTLTLNYTDDIGQRSATEFELSVRAPEMAERFIGSWKYIGTNNLALETYIASQKADFREYMESVNHCGDLGSTDNFYTLTKDEWTFVQGGTYTRAYTWEQYHLRCDGVLETHEWIESWTGTYTVANAKLTVTLDDNPGYSTSFLLESISEQELKLVMRSNLGIWGYVRIQ